MYMEKYYFHIMCLAHSLGAVFWELSKNNQTIGQ